MNIYDIAKEAGVAASTVSRVVNNKPGIKAETREKVQALLKKYNYTPNEAARGLVKQASKIIGILIVDIRVTHHIDSAYYIEQQMTQKGYCCITMSTGTNEEKQIEYIKILEQRRVEGVILMGSMFATEHVKKAIQQHLSKVPVVIVNGYLDLPNVSGVWVDELEGIEKCVELLYSKNHKKLAFIQAAYSPSNIKKEQGFVNAMMRNGWDKQDLWIYESKQGSWEGGYEATIQVVKDHPDIEGIIYAIDLIAVGGIRALHDLGLEVPKQVAVIGVDNSIYGEICMPRLTSLNNKLKELSDTAAHVLITALEGGVYSQRMMLFSDIVERETT